MPSRSWTPSMSSAGGRRSTSANGEFNKQHAVTADVPETRSLKARRTMHTGTELLSGKQHQRLEDLFSTDIQVEVEAN